MSDSESTTNASLHRRFHDVWTNLPGLGTFAAVNHTTIGLRFMVTGVVFFLLGGLLAMLMRTQIAQPEQTIIPAELYNQLFTMHGTVMMFLFAIPILEGLAIYMIPKLIGARDLVFPRISAFGYYCYLFGGIILTSSLFFGVAPDTGWFMYTPLSSEPFRPGPGSDFWLLGITFVEISALAAGVELVASILRSRTAGMSLRRMPIFAWYILVTALMIVFGFPPLILASILLEFERAAGMPFFAPEGGGHPLLWQHLFWLFGHPEVYIIFLPAAGIVSTVLPVFAQRPLVGYRWVVLSVIATGFLSFGLWVHHMFTVGIPHLALAFFSVASMLVAVPTGVQIFSWIATLWSGRVIFSLPMLWILGFLIIFVAGGLTGVMLALVPFNWQVHDTHFVVAHMHYVLVGGMFFPLIAGLYYWLPHLSGRMPSQRLGQLGFWLTFIGFNVTFLMMHLTGLLGMPRRVYTYEAGLGWDGLNLLSSVGGFILAAGIATIIVDVALHFRFGPRAKRNPWRADTLEWSLSMPPQMYNFLSLPPARTRHPLWEQPDLEDRIKAAEFGLTAIDHGRRETYGSDPVSGELREIIHLPSNSWLPLAAALGIAVVCIGLLSRVYPVAIGGVLMALFFLLRWSWHNGGHPRAAPLAADEPREYPLHSRTFDGPGLYGMVVALMANAALYLSLIYAWFFLWTVSQNWTVPDEHPIGIPLVLIAGGLLTFAAWRHHRAVKALEDGVEAGLERQLWLATLGGLAHTVVLIWILISSPLAATTLAHDAVVTILLLYLAVHGGLVTVLTGMQAWRVRLGWISLKLPYEPVVLRPLWLYTMGAFWLGIASVRFVPMAWGGA